MISPCPDRWRHGCNQYMGKAWPQLNPGAENRYELNRVKVAFACYVQYLNKVRDTLISVVCM